MSGVISPSFRSGFYSPDRGGVAEYPDLWRGSLGAWAPCLGPTGLRLYDQSGKGKLAAMTGMDAGSGFAIDGGQYALIFDGINDSVICGSVNSSRITISAWVYRTNGAVSSVFVAKRSDTQYSWELGCIGGTNQAFLRINSNSFAATGGHVPAGLWTHVCGTYDLDAIRIFVNGILVGIRSYADPITQSTVGVTIGARSLFPGAESYSVIRMDDVLLYDSVIQRKAIRQLAISRGIAYTPRSRDRSYSSGQRFNAAWARGANQFVQPSMIGVA